MKRVKQSISFMSVVLILYTLVIWGFLFVFPRFFMGIFTSNSQVIEKGIPCLHIYFFGFFFMALQFSGQSTFTGLGFSKRAIFFSVFRKVIIVIPLTLLLPLFLSSPSQGFSGRADFKSNWRRSLFCHNDDNRVPEYLNETIVIFLPKFSDNISNIWLL